jgi:integrase
MKSYRMFKRGNRFYAEHRVTGEQKSLKTSNKEHAEDLLFALNKSGESASKDRDLAMVFLSRADPQATTRTWSDLFEAFTENRKESCRERVRRAFRSDSLCQVRNLKLVDTVPHKFIAVLRQTSRSTQYHVRLAFNHGVKLRWVDKDLIEQSLWPKVRWNHFRAITKEEHEKILESTEDPERRNFYELCWHLGASQGDAANLDASNIDWNQRLLIYRRAKLPQDQPEARMRIGPEFEALLRKLPSKGALFPNIRLEKSNRRSGDFWRRCKRLGFPKGCVLHSYRYAWIERAKSAGMPERFAMAMMGHQSRYVHDQYAEKAVVDCPSLEEFSAK